LLDPTSTATTGEPKVACPQQASTLDWLGQSRTEILHLRPSTCGHDVLLGPLASELR